MRARSWLLALTLAATWGCGDGIGQPIVGDGRVVAGAGGLGGTSGAAGVGGTGMGGAGTAGTGTAGAAGSFAGATGGAGAAGASGASQGGSAGSNRDGPPDGGGLAPPWDGGIGGRSGEGGYPGLPPPEDVPSTSHCADVADWDPGLVGAEWVIYDHLNAARWVGFVCGTDPLSTPPSEQRVEPVRMDPALRCAARLHSKALSEGLDTGVGPEDRMRAAGAVFRIASESVDRLPPPSGPDMPEYDPILAIFDAGGSRCDNLTDPGFDSVGIGVYREFVTLDFTGP